MKRVAVVAAVVLMAASVCRADSIFDVLTSTVKATTSGLKKTVENADPGKVVENTADATRETAHMAGEATLGGTTNTVGFVSKAAGNK